MLEFVSCSGPDTSEMPIFRPAHCSQVRRFSSQGSSCLELAVPQPNALVQYFLLVLQAVRVRAYSLPLGMNQAQVSAFGKQINSGYLSTLLNSLEVLQRTEAGGSPAFSALAPCQLSGEQGKGQGCLLANSAFTLLLLQSDTVCQGMWSKWSKGKFKNQKKKRCFQMRGLEQKREIEEGHLAQAETRDRNKKERPRLLCWEQESRPVARSC